MNKPPGTESQWNNPMGLYFWPKQSGCPHCGAENVLEKKRRNENKRYMRIQKDGYCRVTPECFDRAVKARLEHWKTDPRRLKWIGEQNN